MLLPKLRFKQFYSSYQENKLLCYTVWSSGGTPSKENSDYWDGDIPLISGASMHTTRLYESDVKITDLGLKKGSKLAPKNSILVLVRGSMLFNKIPMGITLNDVAFNQDVKCIQPKDSLNADFLLQWFFAKENIIQSKVSSTGIGAGKLDTADLQNLRIEVPSKEEQTKIASFLSAVDEKISQLTQKHQLLSQYKQGMMQKLFSQQIRFKADDGSEFGEWEEKELTDVAEINPKAKKLPENFIYIDLESVEKGQLLLQKNIELKDAPSRAQRLLTKGDVLFQMVRPYQQNNYYFNLNGEYVASTGYAQIRTKLNSKFIYYALHEKTFLDEVMNRCTGTSYPAINSSDLSSIEIVIPCLEEQTKIANFLSSIDQKIEVVAQQIEQAKQWKKGLLQNMFI